MRRYETIIITDPDLSDDDRSSLFERIANLISKYEGLLVLQDNWGIKKLAYGVKKKDRGYYILYDYCTAGGLVDELERFFRIDDRVLKYLTVLLDQDVDIESVKDEISQKEAEEKKSNQPEPDQDEGEKEEESDKAEPKNGQGISDLPEDVAIAENVTTPTENPQGE